MQQGHSALSTPVRGSGLDHVTARWNRCVVQHARWTIPRHSTPHRFAFSLPWRRDNVKVFNDRIGLQGTESMLRPLAGLMVSCNTA